MPNEKNVDKDELVAILLCDYMQRWLPKELYARLAVEKYMRTYLRNITRFELEHEVQWADDNGCISELLQAVIAKAADGYDAFMARRRKVIA